MTERHIYGSYPHEQQAIQDRELLEAAAKAAGIEIHSWHDDDPRIETGKRPISVRVWNPLTDDGDALRLAVKLGIRVEGNVGSENAWAHGMAMHCTLDNDIIEHGACPYAATRRAIVRAAAEIGGKHGD